MSKSPAGPVAGKDTDDTPNAAIDRRSFLASGAAAVAVAELPAGPAAAQSQNIAWDARWMSSSSARGPAGWSRRLRRARRAPRY